MSSGLLRFHSLECHEMWEQDILTLASLSTETWRADQGLKIVGCVQVRCHTEQKNQQILSVQSRLVWIASLVMH